MRFFCLHYGNSCRQHKKLKSEIHLEKFLNKNDFESLKSSEKCLLFMFGGHESHAIPKFPFIQEKKAHHGGFFFSFFVCTISGGFWKWRRVLINNWHFTASHLSFPIILAIRRENFSSPFSSWQHQHFTPPLAFFFTTFSHYPSTNLS